MIDSRFNPQNTEAFFEHRLGFRVLPCPLVRAGKIHTERAKLLTGFGRSLRFMNRQGLFESRDRLVVVAEERQQTAQGVQALGNAQIMRAQNLPADGHRRFPELAAFGELLGIAAEQREIVGAFGIVESVFADLGFANLEGLPE